MQLLPQPETATKITFILRNSSLKKVKSVGTKIDAKRGLQE